MKNNEIGRREFVQIAGLAGAGLVQRGRRSGTPTGVSAKFGAGRRMLQKRNLVLRAIDAARSAGAAYADARITRLTRSRQYSRATANRCQQE